MSSINPTGASVQSQASLSALRKTLDAQEQQGAALVDLIKQAGAAESGASERAGASSASVAHTPDPTRLLDVIA